MIDLSEFKKEYSVKEKDFIFPYGSRVYGTNKDDSDYDFLAVLDNANTGEEYRKNNINIHIFNKRDFQNQLNDHKIHTLEAYYLPDNICKDNFKFNLDLVKLRHELSAKASNSFVKAKKKLEVEKDYYIGWKSLFHSLRILNFGIQIAKNGHINFAEANHYWFEILEAQAYNWLYFKEKYQPIYNELATQFRMLAPKE